MTSAAGATPDPARSAEAHRAMIRFARAQAEAIPEDARHPERIGRYRILGLIGRGGMGLVYRATLDHPQREVALKLLAGGTLGSRRWTRFRTEVECLAQLDDPRIVRILDAGTARVGGETRPFLVMELVPGAVPITAWVERSSPSIPVRIAVLAEIAEAVGHAHQRGVIHRDIKPANVLIDDLGRPRIVDFGVARGREHLDPQDVTRDGDLVGTLEWMSPEQLVDGAAVDTRSDVYALGLLAHRVLTGRPSFAAASSVETMVRAIRCGSIPALRAVDRHLDRDLDLVIRTATDPDRERRYGTAGEFAADLRAVHEHRPIAARRPTLAYVASRLIRRHPSRSIIALLTVTGVVSGAVMLWSAETARRSEAGRADTGLQFLHAVLRKFDPAVLSHADQAGIARIMDELESHARAVSSPHPTAMANAMVLIGLARHRFGLHEDAGRALEVAVAANRSALPPAHHQVLHSTLLLIDQRMTVGRHDDAERLAREALAAIAQSRLRQEPDMPLQLRARLARLAALRGALDHAAAGMNAIIAEIDARPHPTNSLRIELLGDLGVIERQRGDDDRSAALLAEALRLRTANDPAGQDPETHRTAAQCAHTLARLGRCTEAMSLLLDALAPALTSAGPQSAIVARIAGLLALLDESAAAGEPSIPAVFEPGPFDRARVHAVAVRAGRTALARRLREPSDAPMVSSDPVVALRMIRDAEGDDAAAAAADRLRAEWTRIDAAIRALLR
ncbi:MAG: serine/threonine protein kinase [Phycisphaeraceae bacterium]|nr:serine/threonine protein kinase [Phycisphaeraceae bacterium]